MNNLAIALTTSTSSMQTTTTTCDSCSASTIIRSPATYFVVCNDETLQNTSAFVNQHFDRVPTAKCTHCNGDTFCALQYEVTPDFLVLTLETNNVPVSSYVSVMHVSRNRKLHLRGVIYFQEYHFTARVVKSDGSVLFYDGQKPGGQPEVEGKVGDFSGEQWGHRQGAVAVMVVYSR